MNLIVFQSNSYRDNHTAPQLWVATVKYFWAKDIQTFLFNTPLPNIWWLLFMEKSTLPCSHCWFCKTAIQIRTKGRQKLEAEQGHELAGKAVCDVFLCVNKTSVSMPFSLFFFVSINREGGVTYWKMIICCVFFFLRFLDSPLQWLCIVR